MEAYVARARRHSIKENKKVKKKKGEDEEEAEQRGVEIYIYIYRGTVIFFTSFFFLNGSKRTGE